MRMPTGKDRRDRQASEVDRQHSHGDRTSTEDASRAATVARLDLVGQVPARARRGLVATGAEAAMPLHLTASRVEKVPPCPTMTVRRRSPRSSRVAIYIENVRYETVRHPTSTQT